MTEIDAISRTNRLAGIAQYLSNLAESDALKRSTSCPGRIVRFEFNPH